MALNPAAASVFSAAERCDVFQTVLLAWEQQHESPRAREFASELAARYDAELFVGVLVPKGSAEAEEPLEVEGEFRVTIPYRRVARDLAAFAHEHGHDLLVVGHHPPERSHRLFTHDVAQELIDVADIPVLIVAEADFLDHTAAHGTGAAISPA
jgi:nucleotide-binding universal stress UspA family protein